MKRLMISSLMLSFLILLCHAPQIQAEWSQHRLPGGVCLESIIVNETDYNAGNDVYGMWIVEKQSGIFWVEWDNTNHVWLAIDATNHDNEYDAYYPWWMGGDQAVISQTPTTIAATYQGTHRYEYDATDGWEHPAVADDFVESGDYRRWHDAAFLGDPTASNAFDPNLFIVCAVQEWGPENKGLWWTQNGGTSFTVISGTYSANSENYSYIYRDSRDEHVLYTWWQYTDANWVDHADFEKVVFTNNGGAIAVGDPVDDFDEANTLQSIAGFYQYSDVSYDHQFLLAKTNVSNGRWDVWHRERLTASGDFTATGWAIICQDIRSGIAGFNGMGLVANKYASAPDKYWIYLAFNAGGLFLVNVPDASQPTTFSGYTLNVYDAASGADQYLPQYGLRSINLNPWTLPTNVDDQIILGTAHGDAFIINIKDLASTPKVTSDGFQTVSRFGYGQYGTAVKGGGSTRGLVLNGTAAYLLTHGSGIFQAAAFTNSTWSGNLDYNTVGIDPDATTSNSPYIYENADFNFAWHTGTISPWDSDLIIVGGPASKYVYGGSEETHGGLRTFDIGDLEAAPDELSVGTNITDWAISSVLGDDNTCLYLANLSEDVTDGDFGPADYLGISDLYVQENSGGSLELIASTGASGTGAMSQTFSVPSWIYGGGTGPFWAGFNCLALHPHTQGVIFGLGLPGIDWGEEPGSGSGSPNFANLGGGLGYVTNTGSNWSWVLIADCDKQAPITSSEYLESVFDLVVEPNGSGTTVTDMYILAATGAYQMSHKSEDIPRYGGLFKYKYTTSWVYTDITPDDGDYALEGNNWTHPAVLDVEKVIINGSNYYFCTTSGEKRGTEDDHISIIWYQQASNIDALTQARWIKFGIDGRIPYTDHHGTTAAYEDFYASLLITNPSSSNQANIMVGAGPWACQAYFPYTSAQPITSNTAWDGDVYLYNNVTVDGATPITLTLNSGCRVFAHANIIIADDATLDMSAGTAIYFGDDNYLQVAGVLDAVGTSGNIITFGAVEPGETWTGIDINHDSYTGSTDSQIKYCSITGANRAIDIESSHHTVIENCTIEDNSIGIYGTVGTNALSPLIQYNTVRNNTNYGMVFFDMSSSAGIYHNTLDNNANGNVLLDDSDPIYGHNVSKNCDGSGQFGLKCRTGASPKMQDGYNEFLINYDHIYTLDTSNPSLGEHPSEPGYNMFFDNDAAHYALRNEGTANIIAEDNYWDDDGSGVDPEAQGWIYDTNNADTYPYLTQAPDGFLSNPGPYTKEQPSSQVDDLGDLLEEAVALLFAGQYEAATEIFETILATNPSSEIAMNAIWGLDKAHMWANNITPTFINQLNNLAFQFTNSEPGVYANFTCMKRLTPINPAAAYDIACSIASLNAPAYWAETAAFSKAMIQKYALDNQAAGDSLFAAFIEDYPIGDYANLAYNELGLTPPSLQQIQAGDITRPPLPAQFKFYPNYPNPFNSSTAFRFDLPVASKVTIELYNITGQKISTIIDATKPAGEHRLAWEAPNGRLASGLYFCKIKATSLETNDRFEAVQKILLLK